MSSRSDENEIYSALVVKALDKIAKQLGEIDDSLMTIVDKLDELYCEEDDDTSVDETGLDDTSVDDSETD